MAWGKESLSTVSNENGSGAEARQRGNFLQICELEYQSVNVIKKIVGSFFH